MKKGTTLTMTTGRLKYHVVCCENGYLFLKWWCNKDRCYKYKTMHENEIYKQEKLGVCKIGVSNED